MSGGRADYTLYAVLAGFALDLLAGDPHWLYHPVRLIGLLITGLEQLLRKLFPARPAHVWPSAQRHSPALPFTGFCFLPQKAETLRIFWYPFS